MSSQFGDFHYSILSVKQQIKGT